MSLAPAIKKLHDRANLSVQETREIFDRIFSGEIDETQLAAFLLALRGKGETVDELLGAVLSMRGKARTIKAPSGTIDIVGTGGDAKGTRNISTATALVVAACGVPVAKHGNRAATSKSGSSDVLAALGVNLEPSFPVLEQCLNEANLCFLFAPNHHPSMRHVADVRKKLGVRTIFNLLGPLTNPANVKRHLIGVYSPDWLLPMTEVLHELGSEAAWLTHGRDGMDELTTTTTSDVIALNGDEITKFAIGPEDAELPSATAEQLLGGDARENALAIHELLNGDKSAYRDIVCFNAGAALVIGDKAADIRQGTALAAEAIDTGKAKNVLQKLVQITNGLS